MPGSSTRAARPEQSVFVSGRNITRPLIIFSTATGKLIDGIGCVGAFSAKFPALGQKPELFPCSRKIIPCSSA